ncbi:MAG: PP2C family protein-serine/threonine phosphatase [Brotaphodocola sp.]
MFSFTYGATTDKGDLRLENQDNILYRSGIVEGADTGLFIIADGMGGLAYGSQVSAYIISQFERWWQDDLIHMIHDHMDNESDIREILEQEIWDINRTVLHFNRSNQCRSGSTLSLLFLYHGRYYIENIGDSRVYRMRSGTLQQLTQDQSVVAGMLREKTMTEQEIKHSGMKHMLTMCIGMFEVPQSCYTTGEIQNGDIFLLCSDGLYNQLSQEEIENALDLSMLNAQEKALRLRNMITPGHASDNVSVIVAEVIEAEKQTE